MKQMLKKTGQRLRTWCHTYYLCQYKNKFAHARKLFVIDAFLIFIGLAAIFFSIHWFLFSPTPANLSVSFRATPERIISGSTLRVEALLENESEYPLKDLTLSVTPPRGFLIEELSVDEKKYAVDSISHLPYDQSLEPEDELRLILEGTFFGTPDADEPLTVSAGFRVDGDITHQHTIHRMLLSPRGSILDISAEIPEIITAPTAEVEGAIRLKNTGDIPVKNITIEVKSQNSNIDIVQKQAALPISLAPSEEKNIPVPFTIRGATAEKEDISIQFTPIVEINNHRIAQKTDEQKMTIIKPQVHATAQWSEQVARPGDVVDLNIPIQNDSEQPMHHLVLSMDQATLGTIGVQPQGISAANNTVNITHLHWPQLAKIAPKSSVNISVPFVIKKAATKQSRIRIPMTLVARYGTETGTQFTSSLSSNELVRASELTLNQDLRFFTNEGDQIGRGILPPKVGEETRIWAILSLTNTTNDVHDIDIISELPNHVRWTGQASMTHGDTGPSQTKEVHWRIQRLPAFSTATLNLELALRPGEKQRGSVPSIISKTRIDGTDSITDLPIYITTGPLSLRNTTDTRLLSKGVIVE